MAKRLIRARTKISDAGIPTRPPDDELPDRLAGVCAVSTFATGARPPVGDAVATVDVCAEAIRLARLLAGLMPGEPSALPARLVAADLGPHACPPRCRGTR